MSRRGMRDGVRPSRVSAHIMLGLGMGLANALGYLFVVILSRGLGPNAFGAFSSLNNIAIVLAIPAGAFQITAARRVARHGPQGIDLRLPLVVGLGLTALTIVLAPLLSHVSRIEGLSAPVLLALGFVPMTLNGALMGVLLGLGRIRQLAAVYVVGGVTRVGAAALSAACGFDVPGTFALVVAATTLTTLQAWLFMRDVASLDWGAPSAHPLVIMRGLLRSNSSMGVLVALTSADVILARYLLTGVESGQYALVSALGRAPVWATQFLALALVPALVNTGSRRAIARASTLVLAVCFIGIAVAAAAPTFWVYILGGPEYQGGVGLLVPYLVLGTLLSLAQVFVIAEMSQGRHILARVTWLAVALQVVLCVLFWHANAFQILAAAAVSTGVVVFVGSIILFLSPAPSRVPRSTEAVDGSS